MVEGLASGRQDGEGCLGHELSEEIRRRGWPRYETELSRSPRVESLNSGGGRPLSILHHARGTAVHEQLRELTLEVLQDLGISDRLVLPEADEPDELWGEAAPRNAVPGGSWTAGWISPWRRR